MIFWGEKDDERLTHTTPDDAIEAIIDGHHPTPIAEIGTVTVHEFAPMKPRVAAGTIFGPLSTLIERLDEEYSDPEGDGTKATETMLAAERAFIAAVLAEYKPWACEPTGNVVTVNALEWAREHAPDWIKSREGGSVER